MDKVLAFSILSASPADISVGAGSGGRWARLSWRSGAADDGQHHASAACHNHHQQQQQREEEEQGARSRSGGGGSRNHERRGRAAVPPPPRFAPEFDGIDCFETIVPSSSY